MHKKRSIHVGFVTTLLLGLMFSTFPGCNTEPEKKAETANETGSSTPDTDAESNDGYMQQVNQLFEKAKTAGQTTASNAGEWIGDTVSGAVNATGTAAQDTGDWVGDTFQSLKDRGLTTANDATEWVQQDLRNMRSFEYKILSRADGVNEEQLNNLGSDRWECFAVDGAAFYFKRQKTSYLKNVPVKDLLKFIPLNGGDGE